MIGIRPLIIKLPSGYLVLFIEIIESKMLDALSPRPLYLSPVKCTPLIEPAERFPVFLRLANALSPPPPHSLSLSRSITLFPYAIETAHALDNYERESIVGRFPVSRRKRQQWSNSLRSMPCMGNQSGLGELKFLPPHLRIQISSSLNINR
jgi:hypothetical protein